jgi:hypothetical protein
LQQVVTVTGVDVKKTGTSKRGPWALRLFDTAGGTKFQTFDVELGEFLQTKIGESVEITYEIEENGDFKNNVIQSIKPATAEQAATAPTQADDPRRSKEELGELHLSHPCLAARLSEPLSNGHFVLHPSPPGLF